MIKTILIVSERAEMAGKGGEDGEDVLGRRLNDPPGEYGVGSDQLTPHV